MNWGGKWTNGRSFTGARNNWDIYEKATCYYIIDGTYSNIKYAKNANYTIINSTEITDMTTTDWTPAPEDLVSIERADHMNYYKELKHYYDSSMGLFCTDKDPREFLSKFNNREDKSKEWEEWIEDITFQLSAIPDCSPAPEDIEAMNKKNIRKAFNR